MYIKTINKIINVNDKDKVGALFKQYLEYISIGIVSEAKALPEQWKRNLR